MLYLIKLISRLRKKNVESSKLQKSRETEGYEPKTHFNENLLKDPRYWSKLCIKRKQCNQDLYQSYNILWKECL